MMGMMRMMSRERIQEVLSVSMMFLLTACLSMAITLAGIVAAVLYGPESMGVMEGALYGAAMSGILSAVVGALYEMEVMPGVFERGGNQ